MSRVLLAGASGFLGTHFLEAFAARPADSVRAIFHRHPPRLAAPSIEPVQANLFLQADCERVVEGIDAVVMAAGRLAPAAVLARDPTGPITDNSVMLTRLLAAAHQAGVKKFLWISSSTGYPTATQPLREEDYFAGAPPEKQFGIGWQHRYGEILCRTYGEKIKDPMLCVALRPSSIYGEFDNFDFATCHALPALLRRVRERHPAIEIWGDGEAAYDYIHAADVVRAGLLALDHASQTDSFNLCSGKLVRLREIVNLAIELEDFRGAEVRLMREKQLPFVPRQFSGEKAERILGFRPQITLHEGLARTLRWARTNGFAN